MKKILAVGLAVIMSLGLLACGSNDVTLNNEQNDLIAEYVAGTMLKYSYDNQWKYTKLKIAQNTYVPKGTSASTESTTAANGSTQTAGSTTGGSNTGTTTGTIGSSTSNPLESLPAALGLLGTSIAVGKVVVGSAYPTDAFAIAVPALSGYQVAAVEFTITNTTGSTITLNSSGSVSMTLTVSGNNVVQSLSILKNDINGLSNISLGAGESYTAAAIFQVEESIAAQVSGSTLTITSGGTSLGTLTV